MKRFVVPPNWPARPSRSWLPPKTWRPDPEWPPPPPGWRFWANANGKPVIGPIGRYGAPSARAAVLGLGGALVFLSINLWTVNALGLLDGSLHRTQLPSSATTVAPTPTVTTAPRPTVTVTSTISQPPPPRPTPTLRPSQNPTRTFAPTTPSRREPPPSKAARRPTPSQTAQRPADLYAEQCRRYVLDPTWCMPSGQFDPSR